MQARGKPGPLVSKGSRRPFEVAAACWMDLLGYGSMIAEAGFNPLHRAASRAVRRLRRFHEIVASHSDRHYPTLVMNDGAATYRDLSFRGPGPTYDFLLRSWELYESIRREEISQGYPGVRLVLATGFRVRGRRAGMDATSGHFKSILLRYQNKRLTAHQAMQEAARIRQHFDIVPQLQANFAFSRAYVAESQGKAGGLAGAQFFVDLTLFETPTPIWIKLGERIKWSNDRLRMQISFAPLLAINTPDNRESIPPGMRTALQVAQELSQDTNVLNLLRRTDKN